MKEQTIQANKGIARLFCGDVREVLKTLPNDSVQCAITSPPYFNLRDYSTNDQIGREGTASEYVAELVFVFREMRRVLKGDGTFWINLGDSFAPDKQLQGIPWRVALALQSDGWILRSEIIWHKPNAMPDGARDRPTKSHEQLFLFARNRRYFYNADAIREPMVKGDSGAGKKNYRVLKKGSARMEVGQTRRDNPLGRNKRSVWEIAPQNLQGSEHLATFPERLVDPCVLAGSRPGDVILDPFMGSGTTLKVALRHGRDGIGIDINQSYVDLSSRRISALRDKG